MNRKPVHFLRSLSISVGMALATSCFAMIAGMAAKTGLWLLPAIAASGLLALAVAHAIGRLARRFPSALGVRTYVKAAFGNTASLFFVFLYLAMIAMVGGVESNLYADIVQQLLPAADAQWVVLGVFAAVFALNVVGHDFSRHAQLALVTLMLGGVLALSACGLAHAVQQVALHGDSAAAWQRATAGAGHVSALPTAIVSAFFLFVGFEWVTSATPGSRDAAAQLPRVLLAAVALLGVVYVCFAAAALLNLDADRIAATRTPQLLLATALWGEPGRWLVLGISTAAVLMAFNAGVIGAARLVYSLAREGCLPRALAATLPGSGAPARAVAATVGVSLVCSLAARRLHAGDVLGQVAGVFICTCYAGLLAASLALSRRQARVEAGDRLAGPTLIEGGALLAMVGLLGAMLFDPAARLPSMLAAAGCALCALLAVHTNARIVRPKQIRTNTSAGTTAGSSAGASTGSTSHALQARHITRTAAAAAAVPTARPNASTPHPTAHGHLA